MRAPVLFLICLYSTFVHAGTIRTETRLKSRVENILPVANAGQDIVLTLPVNSCTLSGTANDEDGSIALYNWVKISGPESGILAQPDSATTTVVGLTQGVYVFRFTVTDNEGAAATDDVQITVAAAPVIAHAGRDTTIYKNQTRPDSAFLNGLRSTAGASYRWEYLSGPTVPLIQSPDSITSWATGITEGFYQFRLTLNETSSDTVVVFVRNWQKRGTYPCRAGYDTAAKTGGLKIVLEPNYKGTYIKPDGTRGTWNQWNFITDVRSYIQSTKKLTLSGGDTLLLEGADSTSMIELGGFGGSKGCPVYVMPRTKPVRIRGTAAFFRIATRDSNVVQHVVVDGTALRSAGYPYGFLLDNSGLGFTGNGPFNSGWVSDFTIKGLRSVKTNALKIKLDPSVHLFGRFDKFVQKNIVITDNWIDSSSVEGMYIGSTAPDGGQLSNPYGPPPRMDSVEISNNIVTNPGWDGIQLANAKNGCVIRHNFVYKAGTANMPSQRAGILMGGNTTGVVESNVVINSKGNGIQVFGYGNVNVNNNIVDSIYSGKADQDGIYESFIVFTSDPAVAPLRVYNYNNLISRYERNAVRIANNNGRMLPGRTHHNTFIHPTATTPNSQVVTYAKDAIDNNTIISSFPIKVASIGTQEGQTILSITQGDTTQTFNNTKSVVDWLFKRLNGVSSSNLPPVADAGADKEISLPADSVFLSGTAADEDGGVVQYQWRKLSGPSDVVFDNSNQAQTLVKNLIAGKYVFEFAVTDNGKAVSKDTLNVVVNAPPIASAGADQVITLPFTSTTLNGTAQDADGKIIASAWTKLTGPASFRFRDANVLNAAVDELEQGVYTFELRVNDDKNASAADTVTVIVNAPPVVVAGPDQTITLPENSVTLQGSAFDEDGSIAEIQWKKIGGPAAHRIQDALQEVTTVDSLTEGTYKFALIATDDNGATATDTVIVTVKPVPNVAPVADAGADQIVSLPQNTVLLHGRGTDADGTITAYQWKKTAGPEGAVITTPDSAETRINNLTAGIYHFELTVTDNGGFQNKDTAIITVNKPPVVFAGKDTTLTLPVNAVQLKATASDADGTIVSIAWTKRSGPAAHYIAAPGNLQTTIESLVEGVYVFQLQVTDNNNAAAFDTIVITVNPKPNAAPVANAGPDKTITLPVNSSTLQGSGTDADGTIVGYTWTKIAGPAQGTLSNSTAAIATATGLAAGSYTFRLQVTDNAGATATDDVVVTVNAALPPTTTSKYVKVNLYGDVNAYANNTWNNWSLRTKTSGNTISSQFKYTDGTASSIKASLSNSAGIADNGPTYGGGMAPAEVLRYTSYHTGARTLTFTGLAPTKKYNIELYASRNVSGSTTVFTVNGISKPVTTFNNLTNAVLFTGLTASATGQVVVNIDKTGAFNSLNGFTLTEITGTTAVNRSAGVQQVLQDKEPGVADKAFELFPNPVTDGFWLKLHNSHTGTATMQVISASGTVVTQRQFTKTGQLSQQYISAAGMAAGSYFVKVEIGGWQVIKQFTKL